MTSLWLLEIITRLIRHYLIDHVQKKYDMLQYLTKPNETTNILLILAEQLMLLAWLQLHRQGETLTFQDYYETGTQYESSAISTSGT